MFLHNMKFILFIIANNLCYNIFNSLNKVLELHLIGIGFIPHNFDKN